MGRAVYTLEQADLKKIKELLASGIIVDQQTVNRLNALLLLHEGRTGAEIKAATGVTHPTYMESYKSYKEGGVDTLYENPDDMPLPQRKIEGETPKYVPAFLLHPAGLKNYFKLKSGITSYEHKVVAKRKTTFDEPENRKLLELLKGFILELLELTGMDKKKVQEWIKKEYRPLPKKKKKG